MPDEPDDGLDPVAVRALGPALDPALDLGLDLGLPTGERLTFVQFSSTFCAPCRATRHVLERVVATTDGVAHLEVDIADHVALGERLGITETPTVLVLDADGIERHRVTGTPTLRQVRAVVAALSGR